MRAISRVPRTWRLLIGVAVILLVVALLLVVFVVNARAAPRQPVPFPHNVMVQAGTPCLFCHTEATRSDAAGIPSVQRCMGCHEVIAPERPNIQKVAQYWQEGKPIPWTRIYQLPRFVHFSHQVHLAASINCERCHGDVGNMTETYQAVKMTMGWCLDCHGKQPNAKQLYECTICHY